MKNNQQKILIVIIIAVSIIAGVSVYVTMISPSDDWKKKTTPLPLETVKTLCENFNLYNESRLCDGKHEVYAPDFTRIIKDTFRPYEEYHINRSESATYDEVESKMGTYRFDCESVEITGGGFSYFRCFYDLRGDRFSVIAIFFTYPDKYVYRVTASSLKYDY